MAFTSITKPSVGDATKKTAFADAVINNLTDLNSRIGTGGASSGIPNSSFEDDGDADGDPDSWTVTNIGGTSGIIATSGDQAHGLNAWKVDYPASAAQGATIQTNDYIAISPDEIIYLAWKMKGTSATGANHVVSLLWYTFNKSVISTTEIYSDPANPTEWTQCLSGAISPSTAKFMKIKIQGSDTTVPSDTGSISFDNVRLVNGPADVYGNSVEFVGGGASAYANVSAGVIWVEAIGAGGGGSTTTRGGGGGGEYAAGYFFASAATNYALTSGAGVAPLNLGPDGGNSSFNSTTIIGIGGKGDNGTGGGIGGTGGTGEITIDGGVGISNADGGHGGAAARGGGGGGGSDTAAPSVPGGGGNNQSSANSAHGMVRIWF